MRLRSKRSKLLRRKEGRGRRSDYKLQTMAAVLSERDGRRGQHTSIYSTMAFQKVC